MRLSKARRLAKTPLRVTVLGLAVVLSACQAGIPVGQLGRALTDSGDGRPTAASTGSTNANDTTSVETAGATAAKSTASAGTVPQATYTVGRGTLRSTLAMTGRVVP